jgi:hypothetical protein
MNRVFRSRFHELLAILLLVCSWPALAATPLLLDGLVEVRSRRVDTAFLLPDADFRQFTKVMIDPAEVAFRRDWMRSVNRNRGSARRINEDDALRIAETARTGFGEIFETAFRNAGYEIATAPGPDVLRIQAAVNDLFINAPNQPSAGRSRTYTVEAGEATLVVAVRDSTTGAVLGVAIDRRQTRSWGGQLTWTNSATNRSDFAALFRSWANTTVEGLAELKERSPVAAPAAN